mmetsp:Transcript_24467/g.30035  ORF Transcript_24467/g.30035 Transcript_24467/m.30035 type:complete len:100 (-) Transcript_24467:45-344(-)
MEHYTSGRTPGPCSPTSPTIITAENLDLDESTRSRSSMRKKKKPPHSTPERSHSRSHHHSNSHTGSFGNTFDRYDDEEAKQAYLERQKRNDLQYQSNIR